MVSLLREVLGPGMLGAYLFGSAVRGGLRPDSDVDIGVILERPLTGMEQRALIDGLMACSRSRERRDRRHLEVTAVVLDQVRPWRYPPPLEFQYGDWWRAEFEAGDLTPWTSPNPDLAVILTSVRADGVPLVGPPAVDLLEPVPPADLRRAARDVIPELLPGLTDDDTRNVLLTLARVWYTLATGGIASKDEAAAWALEHLEPPAGVALRLARAGYLGLETDRWDAPAVASARTDWDAMLARIEAI